MSHPYFSIIIPVYNVEDYLLKCLESVLVQSFQHFEIILVDDGSPDHSGKICDEFSEKDLRITVIHQSNGGLSDARNAGFAAAMGEYIIFLDSDDYWDDPAALGQLHQSLTETPSDILLFNCKDFDCIQNQMFKNRSDYDLRVFSESKDDILRYLVQSNLFPGAAWILSVKKSLLKQNNIEFVKGHKAEDVDWLLRVFYHAEKINAINADFYVYLKNRNGSITSNVDDKGVNGIFYAIEQWKTRFIKSGNPMISVLQYQYLILVMNLYKAGMLNHYETLLKAHRDLLDKRFSASKNNKIASLVVQIFGFSLGAKLLRYLYQIKRKT